MFRPLIIITTLLSAALCAHAQDYVSPFVNALAGGAGYLIGKRYEKQWEYAPIAGATLAPLIVDFGQNIYRSKQERERVEYYISGRNYERWLQSQKDWYQSTLDPHTGRPPAFGGLTEMDRGLEPTEPPQSPHAPQFTVPVKVPAGMDNGIPRTERIVNFPKLP